MDATIVHRPSTECWLAVTSRGPSYFEHTANRAGICAGTAKITVTRWRRRRPDGSSAWPDALHSAIRAGEEVCVRSGPQHVPMLTADLGRKQTGCFQAQKRQPDAAVMQPLPLLLARWAVRRPVNGSDAPMRWLIWAHVSPPTFSAAPELPEPSGRGRRGRRACRSPRSRAEERSPHSR